MTDEAGTSLWRGRTVLVADDVEPIRGIVQVTLRRRFPGLRVLATGDAASFEAIARAEDPDVVVVDWHLGRKDGLRLIMRLNEDAFRGGRIMMTAYTDLPLDPRGLGLIGVDALVRKPFQMTRLVHLVGLLLRSTPEKRARYRANGAHFVEEDAGFSGHLPTGLSAALARYCATGHRNTRTMKFCGECGLPLEATRAPPEGRSYDFDRAEAYCSALSDEPELAARFKRAMQGTLPETRG